MAADASKQPATQLMDTLQWKNRGGGVADPKERSHTRCGPVLHKGQDEPRKCNNKQAPADGKDAASVVP